MSNLRGEPARRGQVAATPPQVESPARPLVDAFGRVHTNLRISVTDRCNIRCFYCMPDENLRFLPRAEILTFEELERFATVVAGLGVNRLRITGGEPLVRTELPELIRRLVAVPGIQEVALTTNGVLLAQQAAALHRAGLHRLNISLDTLREEVFQKIARRSGLHRVLEGIEAARTLGFRIRLNAIAMRGLTEDELVPLARFARERELELRFIEFMPLDAEQHWHTETVLTGEEIRRILSEAIAPLVPLPRVDDSQPAVDYRFADGRGVIGLIHPVSQPFCGTCNRLRLTAEGQIRNCLFSTAEWDARDLIRRGGTDADLARLVQDCVWHKKPGHGIDDPGFVRPARAMYQIGG